MDIQKLDLVRVISITGTILGMAGTLLTGWAQEKNLEKLVELKVNEVLKNK